MKSKRILAAVLSAALLPAAFVLPAQAVEKSDVFSPALAIIASTEVCMKKSALSKDTVTFSEDDFKNTVGVDKIGSITVVSLPDESKGKLMIGDLEVMQDQTISGENISQLKYVPISNQKSEASFSFRTDDNRNYSVSCNIYLLDKTNHAPTVSNVSTDSLKIGTIKNITVFDELDGSDPDNDIVTYEIVKYPESGVLAVTDRNTGSYKYTPVTNYVGKDSFEYRICDQYGNYSNTAAVDISVDSPYTNTVYQDLIGKKEHLAAIRLTELGVMSGTEGEDGKLVFNPDKRVTRAEFLSMAMKATGKTVAAAVIDTGFLDDSSIQDEYKSYVAVASQLGIISGVSADGGYYFYPDRDITRAEASVILNNILEISAPATKPVFSDSSDVPSWASDDIAALSECGILDTSGGYASPSECITKSQVAEMLYKAINLS